MQNSLLTHQEEDRQDLSVRPVAIQFYRLPPGDLSKSHGGVVPRDYEMLTLAIVASFSVVLSHVLLPNVCGKPLLLQDQASTCFLLSCGYDWAVCAAVACLRPWPLLVRMSCLVRRSVLLFLLW